MVTYSIKDIESLTGIKAHTLRIWEKRYSIVSPKRTDTNIRYYSEDDLRHLLNVCYLYKNGHKISLIAKMEQEEITTKISEHTNVRLECKDQVDMLMLFVLQFDSYNLNSVLDHNIDQRGLEKTMHELIYPLLDRLAIAWMVGSFKAMHESYVMQIIRSKIKMCIERIEESSEASPSILIYLTQGESQILSLLYIHYVLKKQNYKVINLGENIKIDDLNEAISVVKPDYLFSIFNTQISDLDLQSYSDALNIDPERTKLILTGYQVASKTVKWSEETIIFKTLRETIEFLTLTNN